MSGSGQTDLYYEAHITVEPYEATAWTKETEETVRRVYGFRVAEFLLFKGTQPPKAFFTARSQSYQDLVARTLGATSQLAAAGLKVLRYKIEDTLMDSRDQGDVLGVGLYQAPVAQDPPKEPVQAVWTAGSPAASVSPKDALSGALAALLGQPPVSGE